MRRSLLPLLVWAALLPAAEPKELAIPPEKAAEAKALIAKLDDDDVDVRDRASAGLETLGRFAYPAMVEALNGKPSNEVRNRLEKLLPAARKADFDARYPLFLADKEGKQEHRLLGWDKLAEVAGDTTESRKLFRDILADDALRADLLLSQATTKDDLTTFDHRWERRWKEWGNSGRGYRPKASEPFTFVAACWLADLISAHERDENGGSRNAVVNMFLKHSDEGKLVAQGKGAYEDVPLKLAKKWIDTRRGYWELAAAHSLCRELKLGEVEEARQLERMAEWSVRNGTGGREIPGLAGTGNPQHVATLKRFFETTTPKHFGTDASGLPEIQVRDAALAMCLVLTDQDPAEYGFDMQYRPKADLFSRANDQNYFFKGDGQQTADEKRAAAFKKWAEWEKANPDKLKAKPPEKK